MKSGYIARNLEGQLNRLLDTFPVVGVLGPRQCGKSTLAKHVIRNREVVYLDLEIPSDLNKLSDAESFLRANEGTLVCFDEIQRVPELFPILRGLCDRTKRKGQYLVLGSSSPELLQQSSESLAGRIAYLDLTPFLITEIDSRNEKKHWLCGGFPDSFLADSDEQSFLWRENFIRTFLERDLAIFEAGVSMGTMRRLWMMLAHCNGQLLNASKLADSLGVSPPTVRRYVEFLQHVYMVRLLQPWHSNTKKRMVKSPKILFRDTGLLHTLLGIEDMNDLFGHPVYGSSWESYVIGQLISSFPRWDCCFYRSARGNEIDLILQKGISRFAVECKASASPKVSSGFYGALDDLGLDVGYVVAPNPVSDAYPLNERVTVLGVEEMINRIKSSKKHTDNRAL